MTNANTPGRKKLLTPEEIDDIVSAEFPEAGGQCSFLCRELEIVVEELENANLTSAQRRQLTARLAAIGSQMRTLRCPSCYLE
jgi:hypothetical protein